ncbi:MAG: phospholipase D-like domain-containing protein [Ferruginibacter sp.]
MFVTEKSNGFSIKAYQGDAKTLLAFSLLKSQIKLLAGFTIRCQPGTKRPFYLYNKLQFKYPEKHAQNINEPVYSTINAPIQKFRWLHVAGNFHQEDEVFYGPYTYTVTPRYFDTKGLLQTIDLSLSLSVTITVQPFLQGNLELGFTRGFVQSQAFENHFGKKAILRPAGKELVFDTDSIAGKNNDGIEYTFKDEFTWSGFTAREKIFNILNEVQNDSSLSLDVFAYDLNEPDIIKAFLNLAKEGRIRILLDNAPLHHNKTIPKPEDVFEEQFNMVVTEPAMIIRGKFSRFQHNKVFIIRKDWEALKVLCGSTNFSVTGVYVNSNHVLVFNDKTIATLYENVFNESWDDKLNGPKFRASEWSNSFSFRGNGLPKMKISFAPHTDAGPELNAIATRVSKEKSSVFFAVMEVDKSSGPIFPALKKLHENVDIFSYGISDSTTDIFLYKPTSRQGIKVTGKSAKVILPPPFNKEAGIGLGHQIHHKFVVCGFNTSKAVLWCGSSNLALLGEQENGDSLLEIADTDIATVFAMEALALVDHFHFRDSNMEIVAATKQAVKRPIYLNINNIWALSYYNKNDLHYVDRELFK